MTFDPRLYLVTGPVPVGQTLEHVVSRSLAGGVTALQFRDKTANSCGLARQAHALAVIARPHGVPLIINDAIEVADSADGAHVGVDDVAPQQAREAWGPSALIGWSINAMSQCDDASSLAASDYVAVSPVWETASKTDTSAPLGLDGVRAVRERIPARIPVVAIGGITAANAAAVIAAGADGIAVISAICAAEDPYAAAVELREIVDEALALRRSSR